MSNNNFEQVNALLNKMCKIAISNFFNGCNVGNIAFVVHRRKKSYGYCATKENWEIAGVPCREVGLTPDCLNEGCERIFVTILHELVHAYDYANGIKDANGSKHSAKFKKTCDERGIYCIEAEKVGYATPSDNLPEEYHNRILAMISELTPEEHNLANNIKALDRTPEEKKKTNRNLLVYQCPECKQRIRASKNLNIICGDCMKQFEQQAIEGGSDD